VLFGDEPELRAYILGLSAAPRPRVCLLPTASGDRDDGIERFEELFSPVADVSHMGLFRRTIGDLRAHLLEQDIVLVSGGNTASMLAVWRLHGVDLALREAWEQGVVLAGSSAGALCWFEGGITDSFGPELQPLHDGLGFLGGSFCPHYDSEPGRRPLYTRLVAAGDLPPGYSADDLVAYRFEGTELTEIVTSRAGAEAFHVDVSGEHPLPITAL
jgi:dipeptidase E